MKLDHTAVEAITDAAAKASLRDVNVFASFMFLDDAKPPRPIEQAKLHRDMQAEWSAHRLSVVAIPRYHGKTTQAIIRLCWEVTRDPNVRIKVVASTDTLAAQRVQMIRRVFESARFKRYFPHVELSEGKKRQTGPIYARRAINVPDPTVEGAGVLGSMTGGRADLLLMDDPVSMRNALTQPAEKRKVVDAYYNDWHQMIGDTGRLIYLGTPWHDADLTTRLMRHERGYVVFKRAVSDDLDGPWPERWPREALERRRGEITPGAFARSFLLRPMAETDAVCRPEWIKYDDAEPSGMIGLGMDLASSQSETAHYTRIAILEIQDGFVLIRDVVGGRLSFPDQLKLVMDLRAALKPRFVAVETVAYQRVMVDELKAKGCYEAVGVTPMKDKRARFNLLGLRFSQETLRVAARRTPGLDTFVTELTGFPVAEYDDTVDAVAIGMAAAESSSLVQLGRPRGGETISLEEAGISLGLEGDDDEDERGWKILEG